MMWTLRSMAEMLRMHAKPEREATWPDYFDLADPKRMHGKGRVRPRDPRRVDTLCIHQTAVRGGFGYSRRLAEDIGPRRALHARFEKVPYHVVALRNGDVILNNAPGRYTYHGNGANSHSLGVAIDGKWPGDEVDDHVIQTGRAALRVAVNVLREAGGEAKYVTAHRCWSRSRRRDPGAFIWSQIVIPVYDEYGLAPDPRGVEDGGEPVPDNWYGWNPA